MAAQCFRTMILAMLSAMAGACWPGALDSGDQSHTQGACNSAPLEIERGTSVQGYDAQATVSAYYGEFSGTLTWYDGKQTGLTVAVIDTLGPLYVAQKTGLSINETPALSMCRFRIKYLRPAQIYHGFCRAEFQTPSGRPTWCNISRWIQPCTWMLTSTQHWIGPPMTKNQPAER